MTLQEGIEKLKVLLGSQKPENEETIVTTEQKFTDAKLQDGTTIIRYDAEELEPGVIVSLVDPSGVLPLPKGDYVLEDGTTFSIVDDMGTADNVTEPTETQATEGTEPAMETPAPATPAAPAPVKQGATDKAPKRVIKSQVEEHVFNAFKDEVNATIAELKSTIEALQNENKELKENFSKTSEISKQMFSIVEQISEEPASAPTEKVSEKFSASEHKKNFKADLERLEKELNNY